MNHKCKTRHKAGRPPLLHNPKIIAHMAQGRTAKQLAAILGWSVSGVYQYCYRYGINRGDMRK